MSNLKTLLEKVDSIFEEETQSVRIKESLGKYFGFSEFRPAQEEVITNILKGKNILAILPTGYGKSLMFQLPALLLEGITVVISPLIALMKDQVDNLRKRGINNVAYINSLITIEEQHTILENINTLKLVYISPEQLRSRVILNYLSQTKISLFVIDEAHCLSQWGHDFRPDYLCLTKVIDELQPACVSAFTATATDDVKEDIIKRLNLKEPVIIQQGIERKNLKFDVIKVADEEDKLRKIANLIETIQGKGIIYTGRIREAEFVTSFLQYIGKSAAFYHGQLDNTSKRQIQENFMSDNGLDIICATSAFGLGIDKKDIRFVIHYSLPGSIEEYIQEAGRAGRDGSEAYCILLYQENDRKLQEWFIKNSLLSKEDLLKLLQAIENFDGIGNFRLIEEAELEWVSGYDKTKLRVGISFLEKLGFIKRYPDVPKKIKISQTSQTGLSGLTDILLSSRENNILPDKLFESIIDKQFEKLLDYKIITPAWFLELTNTSQILDGVSEEQFGIKALNLAKYKKLDKMVVYALTKECRTNYLKRYFGETPDDPKCNSCDNCVKIIDMEKEVDTQQIARFIKESRSLVLTGRFDKGRAVDCQSRVIGGKKTFTEMGKMLYLFKNRSQKGLVYDIVSQIKDFLNSDKELKEFLDVDYIIPVPEEGKGIGHIGPIKPISYAPMLVLSEIMTKTFSLKSALDILMKTKETLPQKDMKTKKQKIRDVLGAFVAQTNLKDKKILLVDDLYDSDAMNECSQVLKQAGASKVYALALTKTTDV
ncbi:MAG: RecQ family ATP-dependent DNA helicase [bacterium]|nr:RecQ family ATP-dependent DNA helicase [bacterium]